MFFVKWVSKISTYSSHNSKIKIKIKYWCNSHVYLKNPEHFLNCAYLKWLCPPPCEKENTENKTGGIFLALKEQPSAACMHQLLAALMPAEHAFINYSRSRICSANGVHMLFFCLCHYSVSIDVYVWISQLLKKYCWYNLWYYTFIIKHCCVLSTYIILFSYADKMSLV